MSRAALWRLPEEALVFDDERGRWKVMAVRGLGQARAVFIPLVRQGEDWRVDTDGRDALPLTPVQGGKWCDLPRVGGPPGCVYLCAIRYDLPSNHPDDSFIVNNQPAGLPPGDITSQDVEAIFERLARRSPDRIPVDVVDGPPDGLLYRPPETPDQSAAQTSYSPMGTAGSGGAPAQAARGGPATATRAQATSRASAPDELSFAFGSCQYPGGMLDRKVAHASYAALARYMKQAGVRPPERLLVVGDQVYTDATYGVLDPARLDDRYRMPYEDMRDRDSGPFSALPQQFFARAVRMTPDDHEFVDNWEPGRRKVRNRRFRKGLAAFWEQQRRKPGHTKTGVQLWEQHAGWRLFMTDTRTQRSLRSVETLDRCAIMGRRQSEHLRWWLADAAPGELKIVTSAAMLLPRSREYMDDPLYLDSWQGYPASFHGLLGFLCERELRNVVFLSGDAHLACSARVEVVNVDNRKSVDFVSHHAPALYAPYPFANETRYNLLMHDRFRFTTEVDGRQGTYECTVSTELVDEGHDGCGLMTARREGNRWSTSVQVLR
jgi:hypothetical protein